MQKHSIHILLLIVSALLVLGVVMLFSTSAFAQDSHGDIYFFVKRQILWLGIGLGVAVFAANMDYHFWERTWWIWFGGAFVLLLLCFVPPVGLRINGSSRWINIGIGTLQPSEVAKIGALFFLAWWFSKFESTSQGFLMGFLAPMGILGILLVPIVFEVDIGNTALIGATGLVMLFVAGAALRGLLLLGALGVTGVFLLAMNITERQGRLLAFLHPEKYPNEFYQQLQGLIAFGSGGMSGLGLGEGRQKMLYTPYAHTDFIFPMIGEELGLRITLVTTAGYLLLCLCGCLVATNARDRFGLLLGFGAVMMITFQAVVNIGVTTALLPNKGMPLPFISYGGSNLMVCLFMIGILINIHRQGKPLVPRLAPALLTAKIQPRL
ncbi:MAG: FtsW/RodA/SpoVE family cell cycle protein [Chthoniobacterales bacterium]|nr:FtsW/RodA/SpoVE family cell cycle protein [Chthoniobacterales bacterium]